MPNPRIKSAKMKANALKKANENKVKSKKGAPGKKTGKVKPAAAVKNTKVYKTINKTSSYNPTFLKESDEKLKAADAPGKMTGSPHHMSNELKYGGPVIDQMQTLSQASASKVLRHMKK
jgi:hypothetical protein